MQKVAPICPRADNPDTCLVQNSDTDPKHRVSLSPPLFHPVLYFMFNLAKEKGFLVLLPSNLVKADGACVTQISRGTLLSFLRAPDWHRHDALVQPEGPTS